MLNAKVLYVSIIGVLTVGLSGCGCFGGCLSGCGCLRGGGCVFPSTSNTLENLHVELYSEANDLLYGGKYRMAVEKYERAFKIRPRQTKVIDGSYLARFKYCIALCYAKLAEVEENVFLYTKAEAAIRDSYQIAIFPYDQAHILYLWGYILFKQARYEEARTKFETLTQRNLDYHMMWDVLYALGKVYMELNDEVAARRTFTQLLKPVETAVQRGLPIVEHDLLYALGKVYIELNDEATARRIFAQLEGRDYVRYDVMYRLGQTYMELDDEAAARRVFARLETKIDTALQSGFPYIADELYRLGHAYMVHGDEAAARHTFTQLLEHYPKSSYKAEIELLLQKL